MKTISKTLVVIGVAIVVGLFSLSFLSSQGFAGNSASQQSPSLSSSYQRGGGMVGEGSYGTSGWGMMGGVGSYGYGYGHMMNDNYGTNFGSYMWNMMNGVYGNFTSWCDHVMSHFFGS